MVESTNSIYDIPTTPEEEQTIKKFKEYLDSQKVEYDKLKYNNNFLIRFIYARQSFINF